MTDWQPIEGAPKDGTTVLLWDRYGDVPAVASFKVRPGGGFWAADTEHYEVACTSYCYGGCAASCDLTPTHWAPLPEPPK